MKKYLILLLSAIVLSLAACTPTKQVVSPATDSTAQPSTTKDYKETTAPVSTEKLPDKNAEELIMISIYKSNADATGLEQEFDGVKTLDAQTVVDKLISVKILEEGTKVLTFDMKDKIGTLNLSQIPSSGTSGETIMLNSIGNTFTENFELEKIRLLINGKNYASGHIEFSDTDYLTYNKNYKTLGE